MKNLKYIIPITITILALLCFHMGGVNLFTRYFQAGMSWGISLSIGAIISLFIIWAEDEVENDD